MRTHGQTVEPYIADFTFYVPVIVITTAFSSYRLKCFVMNLFVLVIVFVIIVYKTTYNHHLHYVNMLATCGKSDINFVSD